MKFSGNVDHGLRNTLFNFGSGLCRVLDPWSTKRSKAKELWSESNLICYVTCTNLGGNDLLGAGRFSLSAFLVVHAVIVLSCPLNCISSTIAEFHSFSYDLALDDISGESGGVCRAGEWSTLGDGRAASARLAQERLHHLRQSQLLLRCQRASGPEEPDCYL